MCNNMVKTIVGLAESMGYEATVKFYSMDDGSSSWSDFVQAANDQARYGLMYRARKTFTTPEGREVPQLYNAGGNSVCLKPVPRP